MLTVNFLGSILVLDLLTGPRSILKSAVLLTVQ